MFEEIANAILWVLGIAAILCLVFGFSQVFMKLFYEIIDGIKNRKKDKKQFLVAVGVICWLCLVAWWLLCRLF